MNLYKKFARNESRSVITGAPLLLSVEDGESSIMYVARAHYSNPEYNAALEELQRKNQQKLEALRKAGDKKATAEYESDLVIEAIALTCVKGVDNVTGEDGMPFVVTPANVVKLFKDLPELAEKVLVFAVDASNYVGTFDEDESLKN